MSMRDWIRKLWPFGASRKAEADAGHDRDIEHYEAKRAAMERILGPMDDLVGHAIIPFQIGGAVDMYSFSRAMPGTVFATMELILPDGSGPKPNRLGTYELVACTVHEWEEEKDRAGQATAQDKEQQCDIDRIERRICGIFTTIGNYSRDVVVEPGQTAEIPGEDGNDTKCLVFDEYDTKGVPFDIEGTRHGLLLCIEVHRSEMEFAMEKGTAALLAMLKEAGHYPYSDLGRQPVI